MLTAEFFVEKGLLSALKSLDHLSSQRSSIQVKQGKVKVVSSDIIAFKATIHGLLKLMETYEKTSGVIKSGIRSRKENKSATNARAGTKKL